LPGLRRGLSAVRALPRVPKLRANNGVFLMAKRREHFRFYILPKRLRLNEAFPVVAADMVDTTPTTAEVICRRRSIRKPAKRGSRFAGEES
jgi:hypothetical protein